MFECYSSSFSVTLLKTINACTTRSANVLPDLIHDTIHISNSDHSPTPSNMQMSQQRKTPCSSLLTNSVPSTLLFSMVLQLHPFRIAASIAPSILVAASAVAASFAPAGDGYMYKGYLSFANCYLSLPIFSVLRLAAIILYSSLASFSRSSY